MTVYLFPGQGSQKKGMGEGLFAKFPELVHVANNVLGYNIEELCMEDPRAELNYTLYTQPALFVVNALHYLNASEGGVIPQYLCGHSLGEFNALFAARVFDFETGLRLVQERARLMAEVKDGGMAAVIGLSPERIGEILLEAGDTVDIANINNKSQIIISGPIEDLEHLESRFKTEGARYIILKVSGAFHSRYMKEPADKFKKFAESFSYSSPKILVIANVTAKEYDDRIVEHLYEQLFKPVRFLESILYLKAQGESDFKEIGPENVLSNIIKNI